MLLCIELITTMKPITFKYIAYRGMEKVEIEADSIGILTSDRREIELQFRKSDGEISLNSISGPISIEPRAANVVRINVIK